MKPKIKLPNPSFQRGRECLQRRLGGAFCRSCCAPDALFHNYTREDNYPNPTAFHQGFHKILFCPEYGNVRLTAYGAASLQFRCSEASVPA